MNALADAVRGRYGKVVTCTDMLKVGDDLRDIAAHAGLGAAILVAWQHGLEISHVPLLPRGAKPTTTKPQVMVAPVTSACPYVYVHVPVRRVRRDRPELVARGIMKRDADPDLFIYHEDALIGAFSFDNPESAGLSRADLDEILESLKDQGVLIRADVDNRQIQFKDLGVKRRIEESGEPVYVRVDSEPFSRARARLTGDEPPAVWDYVQPRIEWRTSCNYCSVQALCPHEVTIHSAHVHARVRRDRDLATVRNYQLGFTYAPFGDPREVCHFLAWDFPHINDRVMNMEPQDYSFGDLIRLVRLINRDVDRFCRTAGVETPEPISGVCNHWAGNSIYHQHYQFFRIPGLPLDGVAPEPEPLLSHGGVDVHRLKSCWPVRAYAITATTPDVGDEFIRVADAVARQWRALSERDDLSYGNEIAIKNNTQNTFVTMTPDRRPRAIFIPRLRDRIDTKRLTNAVQKKNAGVLEMMGYFVIDDPTDFKVIRRMPAVDRRRLGDSWLSELAPEPDMLDAFERNVRTCLSDAVVRIEKRIVELPRTARSEIRKEALGVAAFIQHESGLAASQREQLYHELLAAVLDAQGAVVLPGPGGS